MTGTQTAPRSGCGVLHVLYSLRAEGCPRLALALMAHARTRRDEVAVLSSAADELIGEVEQAASRLHRLRWRRLGFVQLFAAAHRLLRERRPMGVVCYAVGHHVSIAAAAHRLGIPTVLHLGNTPPAGQPARLKIAIQMRAASPFVTAYAACSDHVRRESIRAYRLPADRVVTIPNGIPLDRFEAVRETRRERAGAGGPLRVGMVGSFEGHKDQDTLIDGLAHLLPRDDVKLRLVGGGRREGTLRALADRRGVAHLVEWAGVVHDVAQELAEIDVFAYSVHQDEGLGIALVEALAAGVPIAASDVSACREVLEDGRHGRLVSPNAAAWAAVLGDVRALMPPAPDAGRRYDSRETARRYDALLGLPGRAVQRPAATAAPAIATRES